MQGVNGNPGRGLATNKPDGANTVVLQVVCQRASDSPAVKYRYNIGFQGARKSCSQRDRKYRVLKRLDFGKFANLTDALKAAAVVGGANCSIEVGETFRSG